MRIRPGRTNLLSGRVNAAAVPLQPTASKSATWGGWTLSRCCTSGCNFRAMDSGLPSPALRTTIPENIQLQPGVVLPPTVPPVERALRIDSRLATSHADGVTVVLDHENMPAVEPAHQYVLSGWARSNGIGSIVLGASWFRLDKTLPRMLVDFRTPSLRSLCGAEALIAASTLALSKTLICRSACNL